MTTYAAAAHLADAVRQIAEDNARLHVESAIVPRDVERVLDETLLSAWIARERDLWSAEDLLGRALDEITTAQAVGLLGVPQVRAVLRRVCVRDLIGEAEALQEREGLVGECVRREPDPDARYEDWRDRQHERAEREVRP